MQVAAPGTRAWWKTYAFHFTPSFQSAVNREIEAEGKARLPAA
jgi:hypothetical protein